MASFRNVFIIFIISSFVLSCAHASRINRVLLMLPTVSQKLPIVAQRKVQTPFQKKRRDRWQRIDRKKIPPWYIPAKKPEPKRKNNNDWFDDIEDHL